MKLTKEQQQKNMKKWIKALESGEYDQCRKKLTDGKGFCCLGVAADLFIRSKDNKRQPNGKLTLCWDKGFAGLGAESYNGIHNNGNIPLVVVNWLGLDISQATLISLNDEEKWSFKRIAKYLRERVR